MAASLAQVGLQGLENRQLGSLSGGQLQRALFARLILQDAGIILLDEPFTAIDENTADDLMALIAKWHQQGRTVLAVLHDYGLVRRHFQQSLLLARSQIAWGTTAKTLSKVNLAKVRHAIEARDDAAQVREIQTA